MVSVDCQSSPKCHDTKMFSNREIDQVQTRIENFHKAACKLKKPTSVITKTLAD